MLVVPYFQTLPEKSLLAAFAYEYASLTDEVTSCHERTVIFPTIKLKVLFPPQTFLLQRSMCKPDSEQQSYDERPLVDDLLDKHAKAIASVRESILSDSECKALYEKDDNTKRYDDIWILRYVLSHKGHVKSASKAAMKTIKFREESGLNEVGDLRPRMKQHGVPDSEKMASIEPLPGYQLYNKYCEENAICTTLPDENRGIVVYYDMGKLDQHGLAEGMDTEQMVDMVLYANEAMFQVVDEITRKTGRLTKVMKIVDMVSHCIRVLSYNRVSNCLF